MLNKQKGNMYSWVTHTWNPIKGKCPHDCSYCYMKKFPQGRLRLDKKCLSDNLGEGNTIFVGSSTDMWAAQVPKEWINHVLEHCNKFPNNTYLFQSKNPWKFTNFLFPSKTILGTTIESNRDYKTTEAPCIALRWEAIKIKRGWNRMISIEPILDFDLEEFVRMIREIEPKFVSIGVDSQGHHLPEPSAEKVRMLIKELKKFTEVREKGNLKRLFRETIGDGKG